MSIVDFSRAVDLLRTGAVVAIPTETVYGLAGRIDEPAALRAIFATKRRPFFDPLIVHVASPAEAPRLAAAWTPAHDALAAAFWPGPLTLVVPKDAAISPLITSGLDTVGVRCPAHPLATRVLTELGVPLAAPSANLFGRTSPTTAAHVEDEFDGRVPVLDGGAAGIGVESTVVYVTERAIEILRPGAVTAEDLELCAARAGLGLEVVRRASHRSPGHLETHYQPANKVVRVSGRWSDEDLRARATLLNGGPEFTWLDLPDDPALAARMLYGELRRLSTAPGVILYDDARLAPVSAWEAILDRLRRASTTTWT